MTIFWGFRILNFNIFGGLREKVAIFWGVGHLQVFFEVTFKTGYHFGSVKFLSIFLGIVRESGLESSVELIVVFI